MNNHQASFISLTGKDSHKLIRKAGQGDLSIGTRGESQGDYQLWVEPQQPINWQVLDQFSTPSGYSWPRFLHYAGNDLGFIAWSQNRPIERFYWYPTADLEADFSAAQISHPYVQVNNTPLKLKLGVGIAELHLAGHLAQIQINQDSKLHSLSFSPNSSEAQTYQLPNYPLLADATQISVYVAPLGKAFDCSSLLQFPKLTHLNLSGRMTQLSCLAELAHLQSLALRYLPELNELPTLSTWKDLNQFIGWNIEANVGKLLRTQLKALQQEREFNYSSITQLRSKSWFSTEYGIPFSAWEANNAKLATQAYKACLKAIKKAAAKQEVQAAIAQFIAVINQLPDIETTERDDVGEAVEQLVAASKLVIDSAEAREWFDAVRDF